MLFEARIARQIRELFLTFNGKGKNNNPGWLHVNKGHNDFCAGKLKGIKYSTANNQLVLELENPLNSVEGKWVPSSVNKIVLRAPEVQVLKEKGVPGDIFKIAGIASVVQLGDEATFKTKFPNIFSMINKAVA